MRRPAPQPSVPVPPRSRAIAARAAGPAVRSAWTAVASAALVVVLACCQGGPSDELLARSIAEMERLQDTEGAFQSEDAVEAPEWYRGPGVVVDGQGPARFVPTVSASFDLERTMGRMVWLDAQYRAPGNDDYEVALAKLRTELEAAGFGAEGSEGFLELRTITSPASVGVWNPKGASLTLFAGEGDEGTTLHAFDSIDDVDRVMLPINAPAGTVEGPVALSLDDLRPGDVLVTEVRLPQVVRRAASRGAAAVVSASLASYNVDPTGRDRHRDAIQYRQLRRVADIPVCQISQRSFEAIAAAAQRSNARVRLEARVEFDERPLSTLVAVAVGRKHPDQVMAISAHLHEPGANDNASGVATLAECAVLLAEGIANESLPRPDRSIAFIWGDEFRQTAAFLDDTEREVIAGISADMTGESRAETGAIALLERMPDPGALVTLPPDEHSTWGAGEVDPDSLRPNGLAVIARCAMLDVGLGEGAWDAADHPWEGGSDHDVYLAEGVPAVLFWHFTDFAYHTSLDRLPMVDPTEMRRMGTAILATALAVADARPGDLDRYVKSNAVERDVRVAAANAAGDAQTAERWDAWCAGARSWLRRLCLDLEDDEAEGVIGR